MTLVEMAIAGSLTVVVLISVGLTTRQASGTYRTTSAEADLAMKAYRVLDRVAEELIEALGPTLLFTGPPENAEGVEYRLSRGWDGAGVSRSIPFAFRLEMEDGELVDGLDNDGDDLVDECQLVWVEEVNTGNERVHVLTRWVPYYLEGETDAIGDQNGNGLEDERGFSITYTNQDGVSNVLTLRLTLQRPDHEGRMITKTVQTSVVVRNAN